ncbi:MAG TPA: nitrate reductase molybdenum cofactor assembly chaperone [Burkholderiales bacterium]
MKTYRALAALLSYPSAELLAALPEIAAEFEGNEVDGLLAELAGTPLVRLEERYVALFDRSRALSLHLFEHVHGESRDRGQAMVSLQEMYEARGLKIADGELPDYIPAFLEYLSLAERAEAKQLLQETAHLFRTLGERLAERGSRYAEVFDALLRLGGEPRLEKRIATASPAEDERAALDAQWMDPEVTFGPGEGCANPSRPAVAPVRLHRKGVTA